MRASSTKKYYTGVILFVLVMLFQYQSGFSTEKAEDSGPVIAGVVINSCIGSITISVTSGVAPYTYQWEDSGGNILASSSFVITGLGPDNYTVTVTDANGDDVVATYTVTNPPDLVGTVVVNDVTCRGDSDAQVVVTMANGNPGYDWELFNSSSTSVQTGSINFPFNVITIGGLGVDSYSLEVTDQDGCTGTINFVITEPAQFLGANLLNQTNATCSDLANGSLEVVGTGGWGGYTYAWFDSGSNLIGTSGTISGLLPGTYTLRITDANGCQVTPNYTITGPAPITSSASITPATCNGDSDGAIDITVGGGNGTFSYSWSNGAITQDLSGVTAGTYTLTITDIQGCTLVENYVVGQPDPLLINESITNVACHGDNTGQIQSNVSGGTAPYSYSWSTGSTSANISSLAAGSYSLTVTDANGCITIESFTVTEPAQALSVDSFSETLPSCFGSGDGTLEANVIGGTAPYSYSWSNGGNTAQITGLSSGAYTVTVTDANGCVTVETHTLNDPVRISVSPTVNIPSCNGGTDGSITVSASNGSAPYSYNWNTGDTGPTITGLSAGTYTVTVTDNLGCSVIENIVMGEPSVIQPNATVNAISCNGLTDGSIFLAVTGGTAPYTYSWNTGAVTANISSLLAGSYTVTITDANGCTDVESYTVIEPAPLTASFTKVDVLCKGNTTGSIDLTPAAGTAPYTYLWSTGATTQDVSSLAAGSYSVTIRDASNCTIVENITITEPTDALSVVGVETDVTCNGSTNGAIDITVSGGVGPYTYSWNNGAITEDITGLAAGSYSVQVTDANGCVENAGFTITEPSPFLVTPTVNNVSCNAAGDGSISLAVSGGTAPYTYSWSDGPTTQNRSSLTPGGYTVTVTDANGCQNVQPLTITEPAVLALSYLQQNVACHGDNTGAINVTVSGGTAPYNYSWSNGAITEDLSNLVAGTYNLTVTDANGCVIPETVTISEPSAPLSFTSTVNQITCNGAADGQINLTVSGGTAPYSFNWSNGSTSEDLSSLPAATYSVTITDSQGCTTTGAFNITDPALLVVSGTESNVSCHGAADGSIDLTVSGGDAPYTFIWAHGPITEDVNSLGPGAYTVQVLDSRGCSSLQAFTITEPDDLVLSTASTNVFCFGQTTGQIDLSVTGGTAPYFYSWSNGQNGEDLTGLAAGTYSVTVTDANGCTANESVTITQPAAALGLTENITQVTCNGLANGTIDITVTGGTAPYLYSWNDGFVSEDRNALSPGSYQVTVTDANGCQEIGKYTITEPDALTSSFVKTDVTCFGDADASIDVTIAGGTAPYTYNWADGPTTEDRNSLGPGTYTLTALDANGCSVVQVVSITEPDDLLLTHSTTDVLCFGDATGAIDLTVAGGTAPYSYSWSSGETTEDLSGLVAGTYSITVTDANGCVANETVTIAEPTAALAITETTTNVQCNGIPDGTIDITVTGGTAPYAYSWSDGFVSEDRSALSPGSYQVTVTDANGCQIMNTYAITEPDALTSSFVKTDVTCFGDADASIDVTIAGGTAPYTYTWADGPTTEDRNSLGPGTYTLTAVDANGCAVVQAVTITEPDELLLTNSTTDVLCFGEATGAIDLTVAGGTAPYSYRWSSGETTEDLTGLVAGTYSVTVTDANGCVANETVTITEPAAALAVTETLLQVTCNGLANASIDLTITGGTAPYSFAWNDGQITEDRSALTPGTYSVIITDANGCQVTDTYTITEPTALTTSLASSDVGCFGAGDGAINLAVSGGTSPYSFAWSDGPATQNRTNLTPGGYSVTITDANGCQNTETITITEPTQLLLNYSVADVSCFGEATGSINITVTGGTAPYTYNWSTGSSAEDQFNLTAATYSVTVTDANGCVINEDIVVGQPAAPLAISGALSNETCAGFADGAIDITVTGGTAPYSYSWNTGATSEDISGLLPGTYQVTVTDNLGCSTDQAFTITGPQPLSLTGTVTNLSCRNAGDGEINITVEGGTAPYTFAWSDGQTVEDAVNLAAGSYSILITDANGCTLTETFTVTQPLELVANYLVNDVSCFGEADGGIDVAVSGGTAPYTYAWTNGETTQDLANLTGGNYSLVVTDAQGCKVTAAITVEAPSAPLAATSLITDAGCNGLPSGRIEMDVTGGTAPYSYSWSNGSSQKNLLNVFAGDYALTITDINGCQWEALFTVGEPDAITPVFDVTNTTCFGDTDGSVRVTASGGQAPYTYVWSNGSTSQDQFNLTGGTYNVTITDANNCSVTEAVVVGDSRDLSVVVNKQDIACKGEINGAISLNVTGGSGSYTYLWNDGSTTRDLSGVAAGVYSVVISDAGGCATTATVVISEPALPLTASIDKSDDLSCFGSTTGFATVVPHGGIAPYTYLWSNGARTATINQLTAGTYTVSVTDANGCIVQESFSIQQPEAPVGIRVTGNLNLACMGNQDGDIRLEVTGGTAPYSYLWSTGATTDRISGLRAGDYTVRVVDALGCVQEKQVSVTEPDELRIADARINQSQCFDDRNGSIELAVTGGTRPYSYQWSNQAVTKNLIGISSGTYQVLVTDARGCQVEATYRLDDPELFRLQPVLSEISCVGANDASISLNIEGGVGQLAIQWNTGNVGETITDLSPGQYNVTVTDENGCTLQQNFTVIEPLPVTLDAFVQDAVKCGDPRSGRISLIVSGGREPYTYRWSNGETTPNLVDILPGTYAVTVKDRYGCSTTGTYSVQQPEPLRIGLRTDIVINCEERTVDQRVSADVSGGFGGYKYEWSRGAGDGAENLVSEPGRLTLLITDDQGCTLEKSIDITIPELGEADFDFTSESIVRDGAAAANDPVSFFDDSFGDIIDWKWDFGDGFSSREVDPIHTYSAPGTYTVTLIITDGSGCTSTQVKVIEITEGYRIMVPDAFSPNGDGNNDYFRPRMLGLEKVQLLVFNTWGEVIFSTEDVDTPGWDGFVNGKPAENGNYVYKLIGLSFNGLKVERDGVFALIE